jgi:photosystem II stability/assembly factor-like uncharacterized protein
MSKYKGFVIFSTAIIFSLFSFLQFNYKTEEVKFEKVRSSSSPKADVKMKKGRDDYFFNMLRDPATNEIPRGIRNKEIEFAKKLTQENASLQKSSALNWIEAGPNNVGGRTRALAVDGSNPNIIIAGGAGGGIWKSTDNGATWNLKSSLSTILSVTSIAQDPRPGNTNNWYYTGGEFDGSGQDYGGRARFSSDGIYKSTDNGETWNILTSTHSPNVGQWDSFSDWVSKIIVSPTNGYIYVAANGFGIFRSTDGGNTFEKVLGDAGHHIYSDVDVASNGNLLAVLSGPFQGVTAAKAPGLYKSADNGTNWTNIPLTNYPATSLRGVLKIAPSNPNVGYLMAFTGTVTSQKENILFYKINFSAGTSEERSNNLPDFSSQQVWDGYINVQGSYNMTLAVKPDNENFVMIAGTCMFRSTDGFATKPNDKKNSWIGGYNTQQPGTYPNFHSDVHSFSFDPTDPKKMWWGHDGGLTYTSDITNTSFQTYFPWENKNNGYNVTQYYHISISDNAGDARIMGGCQDNGTPYFVFNGSVANQLEDVSSGDGAFSYFGQNFAYTSAQQGAVMRLKYDQQNNPTWNGWSEITPTGATNQLFIHPFVVDPNNENVMYYPAGNVLWRNNQLGSIPDGSQGTSTGWTKLDNFTVPSGYGISSINISKNPANILYYAASSLENTPKIYKLSNSTTATSGAVEISIPEASSGAYIHDIAINPDDANEILVVMSNYNIVGLYHTTTGGPPYTAVEGNLEGTEQNPGPSLRAATILPGNGYFLATSIGVFSASQLNGNSTVWNQEGQNTMGTIVVNHIASRKSDGRVVAGTHGRGAFVGSAGGSGAAVLNVNTNQLHIEVQPELTRTRQIVISNPGGENLSFTVNASGGESANNKITASTLPKFSSLFSNEMSSELKAESINWLKFEKNKNNNSFPSAESNGYQKSIALMGAEELVLDDGNGTPASFLGIGGGAHFYSANNFQLANDFSLEKVRFFMKTEGQNTNPVRIGVTTNSFGTTIFDTTVNMESSPPEGKWFEFNFPQYALNSLQFSNGNSFQLIFVTQNTALTFPAGYDDNAQTPGNSYWAYYDPVFIYFSGWTDLSTAIPNGAFLIRAVGNSGGGGENQQPVANAQVSPNPAGVGETINFNGSGSYDNDGQIAQYLWNFGDGSTSSQMNATHSYSQTGQYNYSLTVTDNQGATGQTSGQVNVSDKPSRWTINPSSGSVSGGGSQNVSITFSALNLPEGNYTGQITITSNGGNTTIPVTIFVSSTVDVNENDNNVYSYKLEQNYPNPFNPSTTIRWSLAEANDVMLKIYNIRGEEVATLVNEYRNAGTYETIFDAAKLRHKSIASGVYFYTLNAGEYSQSRKFVLLK